MILSNSRIGNSWIVYSCGRDGDYDINPPEKYYDPNSDKLLGLMSVTYDPTNGTDSSGDIWRVKQ